MTYRRILVAVEFSEEADAVIQRAKFVKECLGGELILIHVVEPAFVDPAYDVLPALPAGYETELISKAEEQLTFLAHKYGMDASRTTVAVGSTKSAILEFASNNDIELIIVGSHGRHGLALLLGSTANAVLHGAPCDVLAVKVNS